MIETLTLISLCVLYLIYFRPGKTPPLNNPLIIERTGHYRAHLAPQLNLAQPFIEAIVKQIELGSDERPDNAPQIFEVYDSQVTKRGQKFYLLSISQRDGMLHFDARQTAAETAGERNEFSKPEDQPVGATIQIISAVKKAAQERGITIRQMQERL